MPVNDGEDNILLLRVWLSVVPTILPLGAVTDPTLAPFPVNIPVKLVVVDAVTVFGPGSPWGPDAPASPGSPLDAQSLKCVVSLSGEVVELIIER